MEPTTEWTCGHCGKACSRKPTKGQRPKWCSPKCAEAARVARLPERVCPRCGTPFAPCDPRVRYCSRGCAQLTRAKDRQEKLPLEIDQRGPIRRAIEDGNGRALLAEVRRRVLVSAAGCWDWQGLSKDGYAVVRWGKKPVREVALHRAVLEAKSGAQLGVQHAHHICGNRLCVNPDHLQPVTYRDNVAEMLARSAYVNRIAELERALAELAPHHPLLDRVPLAS